jgi:uncharacterized protein (UPF0335 family)
MPRDNTIEPIESEEPKTLGELARHMDMRFDALAALATEHFGTLYERIDRLEKRVDALAADFEYWKVEARGRFDQLELRTFPRALDREDLESRVTYLEKKLGIESGR